MSSQIETCIGLLNESCDTRSAYFSFTTDDTGEHGVIKANKDGLRLYALELLKKSREMETDPSVEKVLFFDDHEWMVDDAGYNLIWGVDPTNATREELLAPGSASNVLAPDCKPHPVSPNRASAWLPSLIILSGGLVIVTIAALKWFH